MSFYRQFFTQLYDGGDLQPVLEQRITTDYFQGDMELYRAFEFISSYWVAHHILPTIDVVQRQPNLKEFELVTKNGASLKDCMHQIRWAEAIRKADQRYEDARHEAAATLDDPSKWLENMGNQFWDLGQQYKSESGGVFDLLERIEEDWDKLFSEDRLEYFTPWPWPAMNKWFTGIPKGSIILIYAIFKQLKTWVMYMIMFHALKEGKRVGLISPELEEYENCKRIITLIAAGDHDFQDIYQGTLGEESLDDLHMKFREFHSRVEGKLFVLPIVELSPNAILSVAQEVRKYKIDIVFFDALNLTAEDWKDLLKTCKNIRQFIRDTNGCTFVGTFQANRAYKKKIEFFKVDPLQDVGGSLGFAQICDLLIRTNFNEQLNELELSFRAARQFKSVAMRRVVLSTHQDSFLQQKLAEDIAEMEGDAPDEFMK